MTLWFNDKNRLMEYRCRALAALKARKIEKRRWKIEDGGD
jgi:hypothetical protein